MAIGVLVPPYDAQPGHPSDKPIGRAALRLEAEGLAVVFGHEAVDGALRGVRATPDGWREVPPTPVSACYDRFPSRSRAEAYGALRAGLGAVPLGNPPELVELCADKWACQLALQAAGIEALPEQVDTGFDDALARWGSAFLKPRYGAFGTGVRRLQRGQEVPRQVEGPLGTPEPALLQRAVPPPKGWAGVACRVLVQRTPEGGWWAEHPVARRSRTDCVVNASRGAEVVPLAEGFPDALQPTRDLAIASAEALAAGEMGDWLVEVGVDVVLDEQLAPWVVEVNSRPRGRLEALLPSDPRWMEAHVAACARPLRRLAAMSRR
jgi:glutathione synthase/RimK-type ligase-like ATP-grasp enzyme